MSPTVGAARRAPGLALVAAITFAVATASFALAMPAVAALPANYLSPASTWRYSDNNTDPADGSPDRLVWTYAGFDDTAWPTGSGAFGAKWGSATPNLGSGFPVTTVLRQYINPLATPRVNIPTFHFRTTFEVTADDLAAISGLAGRVTYDDAVQIFVNGALVARFLDARLDNVPDSQKNLAHAGTSIADPVTSAFTVPAAALAVGTNTVAIALYQDNASSSDVYLNLSSLAPLPVGGPAATLSDVVLGVGADESRRNLSWYSSADVPQVAQFAPASSVVNGVFPPAATSVPGTGGATTSGEYHRFATLSGLQPETAYAYRVGNAGAWSPVYTFRTRAFDGDFSFLFFGDAQIGSSGNVTGDAAGWASTLDVALAAYPDAELLISAGDQVEHAANEAEYAAFLQPDALREVAFGPTIGNHDVGSKAYEQHFNPPNLDRTAGAGTGSTSGGDYWFTYREVLFLVLNSNSLNHTSHIAWMRDVIAAHGALADWIVLAMHHPLYSGGPHATDSDANQRRAALAPVISELGIDLVLTGHDHSYARSFLIADGAKADAAEVPEASVVNPDPGDALYVTAGSSSGSKYYSLQSPGFWWLSAASGERVRSYVVLEVSDDAISVTTRRSQSNASGPVNSMLDQVTLAIATTPPPPPPPPPGQTVTVTLQPTADTMVAQNNPNYAYGGNNQLSSRSQSGSTIESYLRFAVPPPPAGATLTGVTLRVVTSNDPTAHSTGAHQIRLLSGSWSEATTTWNNRSAAAPGQQLGQLAGAPSRNTAYLITLSPVELAAAIGAGGLNLALTSTSTDNLRIHSREATATGVRPTLTLTYTVNA